MNKAARIKKVFIYGVFLCYLFLLIKILFLSRISHLDHRSINIIPFYSIMSYISTSSDFAFGNVVGNIIIFVPLGTYFLLFRKDKRVLSNLIIIVIVSLMVEITQGFFGIGASDIDDIILNSFGGLIGILGYKFFLFLLREDKKVHTAITTISAMGLPFILYYLFMVRMRF